VADYEQHYEERHVPHSTALHSVRKVDGSCYFVGPLARVNLSLERLSPTADGWPTRWASRGLVGTRFRRSWRADWSWCMPAPKRSIFCAPIARPSRRGLNINIGPRAGVRQPKHRAD